VNLGLLLAVVSVVISIVGIPGAIANRRRSRDERSAARFVRALEHRKRNLSKLTISLLSKASTEWIEDDIPILVKSGWILPEPVPLSAVRLNLATAGDEDLLFEKAAIRARRLMPRKIGGGKYLGYSDAIMGLGNSVHLFNGQTYRPLDIRTRVNGIDIDLCSGRYFDHMDTSTVLALEAAQDDLRRIPRCGGAYRRFLRDPFDLRKRSAGLGVNTLTVRRGGRGSGFYLHRRDGMWVVEAPDVLHVVPAGEFAPSSDGPHIRDADCSLWRNIMREYAEEFLDMEEFYGKSGESLDFANRSPFRELDEAYRSGLISVHVLGVGLDPLDWKPELLTVCVIEADVFDRIFARLASKGAEGVIIVGERGAGIPFDRPTVETYLNNRELLAAGDACLRLAWRHRDFLGIG